MARPNIVYIHSHDTGRFVQPYGAAVPTPNIQRLAEQGVVFRHNFSVAPTCSPSRAGLLTGQCAHASGMIGLAHRGFALTEYSHHVVHTLRGAGYASTLVGEQHEARRAEDIGYDRVIDPPSHDAADVAPAAVRFLESAPKQPFFLSVGFAETHREFHQPGPAEDPRFSAPPPPLPDTPATRRDWCAFKASARALDEGMGAVFSTLDRCGLADNSLVICTTDHGPAFPAMKCNLNGYGTGVMLIMRGPGGFEGGRVSEALVSHIDVFPTLCELLDIARPPWLEGQSLMPLVRGECEEIHDEVFAEVTYHAAYEPQRSVRTKRWSYVRRFGGRRTPVLPNIDDSVSKNLWQQNGYAERRMPTEQLYDLVFDPGEACNLAADPAVAGLLAEMRNRLDRWMKRTNDPLLLGESVPAPSGAVANDPEGVSPREPTIALG